MKKITRMLVLALALVVSLSLGAGSTAEAAVTAKKMTAVDKLTNANTVTLSKGKKATLVATVTLSNKKTQTNKAAATFKSSNKKVATVNAKGVITAKKAGTAKITVTSKKKKANGKKISKKVTVKVVNGKVKKITLKTSADKVKVGDTATLTATVKTSGKKPNKTLAWIASNDSATVAGKTAKKATVTAQKVGTVTLTAKATDGTKKTGKVKVAVEGYTVTPLNGDVEVKVAFKSGVTVDDIQKDLNKVAGFVSAKDVEVTLDNKAYTATVDNGVVKINGKELKDSAQAKAAKEVTIKTTVKTDKIAALVAFTPATVASVTVKDTTITDITVNSFKVGTTTVGYAVAKDGKTIEINAADGNVVKAFEKLTAAKLVEVK